MGLIASCSGDGEPAPPEGAATLSDEVAGVVAVAPQEIAVLDAVWETPRDTVDNIDSPAVWHGPAGEHWLLVTAKETDVIVAADASTGELLRRIGTTGTARGQMDRPNGLAVVDDFMFLVERDNARVQVFSLPDFMSIGTYGEGDLRIPYGIAIVPEEPGVYSTFITDNYEIAEDTPPPDSLLYERVRHYRVTVADGTAQAALENTFGDTTGDGVLRIVESIASDHTHDRLLVAEETEGASMVKAYTLAGSFRGEIVPDTFFPNQAEGIALYECGGGRVLAGYGPGRRSEHLPCVRPFDARTSRLVPRPNGPEHRRRGPHPGALPWISERSLLRRPRRRERRGVPLVGHRGTPRSSGGLPDRTLASAPPSPVR